MTDCLHGWPAEGCSDHWSTTVDRISEMQPVGWFWDGHVVFFEEEDVD